MSTTERLSDRFEPEHYELFLHPDKERMAFTGRVSIRGRVSSSTHTIKLHAKGLKITAANFQRGGQVHAFKHKYASDSDDMLLLDGPSSISGKITIDLEFSGRITEPMVGLYPCKFKMDGQEMVILATQFESHHAREVFPCIDEPAAKATFDLRLKTPVGETVLANTEPVSESQEGDWVETAFATTPKMSTYLLAFVSGRLASRELTHGSGVISRVWTTPDNIEHTGFALDVAARTLDFYNDYFDTPYPLNKCDHVALPDFAAGAMENWGLITYRESMFTVDERVTSLENKQTVALVIAHELAHQWFGNLVTMQWWTDLWLNEGFASWIEYLAIDHLFPDWHVWDQFVSDEYLPGMSLDGLKSSHPVEVKIDDPDDIRSIFDAISYNKGASVIRMLHAYLGPEAFKKGLRQYLLEHAYDNASTQDLWRSLEQSSHQSVEQFMSAWTSQTGYPQVSVTVDPKTGSLKLEQERYLLSRSDYEDTTIWPIPLDTALGKETELFDKRRMTWSVDDGAKVKLNRAQTGWYITRYDKKHTMRLAQLVADQTFGPLDRLGPLNDAFRLAKAGQQDTAQAFDLLSSYGDEDNVVVWDVLLGQLVSVRSVFDDEQFLSVLRPFVSRLLEKQYARIGWDDRKDDNHFDKLLRPLILAQACSSDMEAATNEALERFKRAESPHDIAPDIRGLVCATAGRKLGHEAHKRMLQWYRQSESAQIKSQLCAGLCSTREKDLIVHNFELIKSGEVKLQDVAQWISYLFANRYAKTYAWQWFQQHWPWLHERFGTDIMTMSYFPKIVGNSFSDSAMVGNYEKFFASVDTTGLKQPVAQGLESLQWRSAWRERDYEAMLAYLKK